MPADIGALLKDAVDVAVRPLDLPSARRRGRRRRLAKRAASAGGVMAAMAVVVAVVVPWSGPAVSIDWVGPGPSPTQPVPSSTGGQEPTTDAPTDEAIDGCDAGFGLAERSAYRQTDRHRSVSDGGDLQVIERDGQVFHAPGGGVMEIERFRAVRPDQPDQSESLPEVVDPVVMWMRAGDPSVLPSIEVVMRGYGLVGLEAEQHTLDVGSRIWKLAHVPSSPSTTAIHVLPDRSVVQVAGFGMEPVEMAWLLVDLRLPDVSACPPLGG